MTRLHQHFQLASAGYHDGQHLLGELQASLEAFNRDNELLHRVTHGDQSAIEEAQKIHGFQMASFGVSLEAVNIHVNSNQVQQVVDFLKKWIPILLKKIRDLGKRFIAWVKVKLQQIGERISALKTKFSTLNQPTFTFHATKLSERAGLSMFQPNVVKIDDYQGLQQMFEWLRLATGEVASDKMTVSRERFGNYASGAALWLTGETDHPAYEIDPWTKGDDATYLSEQYRKFPSSGEFATDLRRTCAGKVGNSLTLSKSALVGHLDRLNRMQLNMVSTATNIERNLREIERDVTKLQNVSKVGAVNNAKFVVNLTNYTIHASSTGLQERLRIVGYALDLAGSVVK
ncbi:hypothetical protein [Xanthomonas phage RTH11]|nr:hypothetical protein [Xanthomonas phage RTH11]